MKAIKDPVEIRRIEGYRALELLRESEKEGIDVEVDIRAGKKPEEIQKRCNMMSDYMSEIEGPEEDETREPRPDEPEEYWIKNWLTISIEKECFKSNNIKFKTKMAINIIDCGDYYKYSVRGIDTNNYFPGKEFSNVIDCLKRIYEKGFTIRNCGNRGRDKYKREFLRGELNKLIAFYYKVLNGLIEGVK